MWTFTWTLECHEDESVSRAKADAKPLIFAHWHGHELCIVPLVTSYKIATMTSTSKDGQLIDFVIRRLGGATSRGSSTRGGVGALKGLVRLMGQGYRASMAVDGPKGPLHKVKPGVFELSRLAEAQIVPVGVACSNAIVFKKSWNKALLPKPFTRVVVTFGPAQPPVERDQSAKDFARAEDLAAKISNACRLAGEHLR
jgi:lysophospholipid acyltransferase (LPLAT)-like uncharacterized protein